MQFINIPRLVASKMVWTRLLLVLVLSMSPYATDAILCRGGFTAGTETEYHNIECTGDNNTDWACYAMYTEKYEPGLETGHWTYGCILVNGLVDKCGLNFNSYEKTLKNFSPYDVDNYYCCCTTNNCNHDNFHDDCWIKYQNQPVD